jgi:hypothetical protein
LISVLLSKVRAPARSPAATGDRFQGRADQKMRGLSPCVLSAAAARKAIGAKAILLRAVATSEMTPEEPERFSAMPGSYLKVVEAVDLDRRVRELEGKIDGKSTMVYRK